VDHRSDAVIMVKKKSNNMLAYRLTSRLSSKMAISVYTAVILEIKYRNYLLHGFSCSISSLCIQYTRYSIIEGVLWFNLSTANVYVVFKLWDDLLSFMSQK